MKPTKVIKRAMIELTTGGRLLVCGDRNWDDLAAIKAWLKLLKPRVVIHGAARGADTLAGEAARQLKIEVVVFPAQWARYGRGAGPIRNQQMIDEGRPDTVLAFHADLAASRGTKDMLDRARRAGIASLHIEGGGP